MESLVREMQDPENGVPVRSQKLFLTSIPSAFMGQFAILCVGFVIISIRYDMRNFSCFYCNDEFLSGYDMIEWLMERLNIEDSGKICCLDCSIVVDLKRTCCLLLQWKRFTWPIFCVSTATFSRWANATRTSPSRMIAHSIASR